MLSLVNSFEMLQRGRTRGSAERKSPPRRLDLLPARFNGAALVGVRRVAGGDQRRADQPGFNGAALVGVRRAYNRMQHGKAAAGFNGAALVGVRRVCAVPSLQHPI